MTDRKLLEAAAKAAGYWSHEFNCPDKLPGGWDPLTDDGDALRLAVALGLKLETNADSQFCGATTTRKEFIELWSDNGDDAQRAMRHVIVRAAASMAASES